MSSRLPVRKTYKLFVGGAFPRSESGRTYEAEGQNVARASRKDARDAVRAARAAVKGWAGATAYNRGQVLYRVAEMVEARTTEFAELSPAAFRESYLRGRGFDPALWWLARDGDRLVGFMLAFSEHAGDRVGWLETLAVRPRWRRRGLGEALMRAAILELHTRGFRSVGLGVDGANGGAVRLYERLGFRVAYRWESWERSLRDRRFE